MLDRFSAKVRRISLAAKNAEGIFDVILGLSMKTWIFKLNFDQDVLE
jgi:hypothetical protein